jgi:hypothetical protein
LYFPLSLLNGTHGRRSLTWRNLIVICPPTQLSRRAHVYFLLFTNAFFFSAAALIAQVDCCSRFPNRCVDDCFALERRPALSEPKPKP